MYDIKHNDQQRSAEINCSCFSNTQECHIMSKLKHQNVQLQPPSNFQLRCNLKRTLIMDIVMSIARVNSLSFSFSFFLCLVENRMVQRGNGWPRKQICVEFLVLIQKLTYVSHKYLKLCSHSFRLPSNWKERLTRKDRVVILWI